MKTRKGEEGKKKREGKKEGGKNKSFEVFENNK